MDDMQAIVRKMVVSVVDDRMQGINVQLKTLCRKISVICNELQSVHEKKLERIREIATSDKEGVRATDISESVRDVFADFFDSKDDPLADVVSKRSDKKEDDGKKVKPGVLDIAETSIKSKPTKQNVVPASSSSLASQFGKFDGGNGEIQQIV